jgi:hypothetical protein
MKVKAAGIIMLAMFCAGAAVRAEGNDSEKAYEAGHQGFYFAMPVYLYGADSAHSLQLGYQVGRLHVRLDASMVSDTVDGDFSLFAIPSIGAFFSEEWESRIRTYQGAAFGVQAGIHNSFEGLSCFLNVLTGAEWFVVKRKAFFLEIGSCISAPDRDGNLKNGTVIGGGIKCFF